MTSCVNEQERWREYYVDVVGVESVASARTSETDEVVGRFMVGT